MILILSLRTTDSVLISSDPSILCDRLIFRSGRVLQSQSTDRFRYRCAWWIFVRFLFTLLRVRVTRPATETRHVRSHHADWSSSVSCFFFVLALITPTRMDYAKTKAFWVSTFWLLNNNTIIRERALRFPSLHYRIIRVDFFLRTTSFHFIEFLT